MNSNNSAVYPCRLYLILSVAPSDFVSILNERSPNFTSMQDVLPQTQLLILAVLALGYIYGDEILSDINSNNNNKHKNNQRSINSGNIALQRCVVTNCFFSSSLLISSILI